MATELTHRRVLLLALPIILSNLSVPLVGLVDTAVMGRLPDPAFIGAVALGGTIFSFLFWSFGFLRMGMTGLVSQAYGRNDAVLIRSLLARHFVLAAGFGFAIVVLQGPLGWLALQALPASDKVESALLTYYKVRVISAPAVLGNYVLMGVFIGMQRTAYTLVAQLVLNLSNAALSVLLVLHYGLGIEGVAWGSVVAEYLALAVGILLLVRLLRPLPGSWPLRSLFHWREYLPLLSLNANIFVRTLCLILGFAWFTSQGARFGDLALAVNAILMNWVQVLAFGLDGFAHAAETLVGSAIGAGKRREYRWAIRTTTLWAAMTAIAYSLVYALFADNLVAMLTTIDAVREHSRPYYPWLIVMPLLGVWSYQLDGIFVGSLRAAQMRDAMIISTVTYVLLSLGTMALWQNHGLWLAMAAFFVLRAVTLGWFLWRHPVAVLSDQD